ncbi:ATP-binding protein, partial [Candidatus Entotheonella palauensis]
VHFFRASREQVADPMIEAAKSMAKALRRSAMPQPVQASSYTFRDIIEGGFLYVDKTRYLYDLIRYRKGVYFLARPRRFGKSLMISTLDEIFQGNRDLFRGLWLYESDYDWQTYPVVRIDFSRHQIRNVEELEVRIQRHLTQIAQHYEITLDEGPFDIQLEDLILKLAKEKQVVILIDEYDKPILDNVEHLVEAQRIRDTLKSFYTTIKAMDAYIRFVFITGISKFSRVGVFSSMNHLDDLTMDPRFATALGITEDELVNDFREHIDAFAKQEHLSTDQLLQNIREWYDGFCFVKDCQSVYNPFSTLQLFNKRNFSNYWFESGTPTFLIKLLKEHQYPVEQLEMLRLRELAFSTYEIESLSIVPLLFQTGYLTIKDYEADTQRYTLSYPNAEVEDAFLTHLLGAFSEQDHGLNEEYLWQLVDALHARDLDQFFAILQIFFANVPYDIQLRHEKYYQTIFYLIFKLMGWRIDAEVRTNRGRIDAVIELANHIFLFEFKLDGGVDDALQQIVDNAYAERYRAKGKPVTLIGANFDSRTRTIDGWKSKPDMMSGT